MANDVRVEMNCAGALTVHVAYRLCEPANHVLATLEKPDGSAWTDAEIALLRAIIDESNAAEGMCNQ
jgi:hypothetical protein